MEDRIKRAQRNFVLFGALDETLNEESWLFARSAGSVNFCFLDRQLLNLCLERGRWNAEVRRGAVRAATFPPVSARAASIISFS
jgi:hypothetical protein